MGSRKGSRPPRPIPSMPLMDLGPEVRSDVAVEDRPDPDRPLLATAEDGALVQVGFHTTRGARSLSGHDYLHRRGAITWAEHQAALKYVVTLEQLYGATWREAGQRSVVPPWQKGAPFERQIEAASELRRLREIVGVTGMAVVDATMCHQTTIARISQERGECPHYVTGRLRAALDRMAEYWGIS